MTSKTVISVNIIVILFLTQINCNSDDDGYCPASSTNPKCGTDVSESNKRYILYDINPPEGFNLRRDVYVRVSAFVRNLIEKEKKFEWTLVLPPWGPLYHWQSNDIDSQKQLPWGLFFDIPSLQKYVPVIEMYQYLKEYPSGNGHSIIDRTYILQNDEEMFKTGKFEDKNKIVKCSPDKNYYKFNGKEYYGHFWGYQNITTKSVKCVVFHGMISGITKNLMPHKLRSIKFDHMEIPLHDSYGSADYWAARRSMRYNKELYEIANKFRQKYLNSNDTGDRTERPEDWTEEKGRRNALGGPYVSVHLRRKDFIYGHKDSVPTIKRAALQLQNKLEELKLNTVFVASDTNLEEYRELQSYLSKYTVLRYSPSQYVKNKFKDGGIAIIDQIICSYSRYFLGTKESTFTFRIQEDREIIGFPADSTFNFLCAKEKCSTGGRWEIVW